MTDKPIKARKKRVKEKPCNSCGLIRKCQCDEVTRFAADFEEEIWCWFSLR